MATPILWIHLRRSSGADEALAALATEHRPTDDRGVLGSVVNALLLLGDDWSAGVFSSQPLRSEPHVGGKMVHQSEHLGQMYS